MGAVVGLGLALGGCADGRAPVVVESSTVRSGTPRATPETRSPVARASVRVPDGVRASYAVFEHGAMVVQHRPHQVFRSASVIKLLIALDQLEKKDDPLLGPMLRSSDDGAASELWRRNGRGAIVTRMARKIGLTETAPPPAEKPGFWGYSALSAADVVKIYRYLLEKAPAGARETVLGELRRATRCGTDHFDQFFGIPRALKRPWAVKQGWSGFGDAPGRPCSNGAMPALGPDLGIGRPVLHTTGIVGDKIVVVLTLQPAGTSFSTAYRQVTGLTREVFRAAGG
ncbi:hypothetical protein AB0L06_31220 [Spirillospora sp. NPDC052269]